MALLGGATVGFLRVAAPSVTVARLVLLLAAAMAALILAAAYVGAEAAIRPVHDQLSDLRNLVARGLDDLCRFGEGVKRGDLREVTNVGVPPPATSDPFDVLVHDLRRIQDAAQQAVLDAVNLAPGPDQRVEVFVNLAWRMQSLVHREIQMLDELEAQVEDPDLLKGLFTVDHLATLLRRQTESLAVLGGAASRRRWSNPVTMYDVLRSAVAEVEQYSRVKLVLPIEGTLHGDAVAHIIHLVAELVENATKFSPPETQVLIRAENVTAGLAIEVEDRGLGIALDDRHRMNDVLADPGQVNIGELLRDGRIGLFVVSALARRHGVRVELQRNVYGGTQAVIVLPRGLVQVAGQDGSTHVAAASATSATSATLVAPAPRGAIGMAGTTVPSAAAAATATSTVAAAALQKTGRAAVPAAPAPVRAAPPVDPQDRTHDGTSGRTRPGRTRTGRTPTGRTPSTPTGRGGTGEERPPLPQRRVQQSLAPQLRETPASRHDESTADSTPNLMADFLRGVSRSAAEDHPDDSNAIG